MITKPGWIMMESARMICYVSEYVDAVAKEKARQEEYYYVLCTITMYLLASIDSI